MKAETDEDNEGRNILLRDLKRELMREENARES